MLTIKLKFKRVNLQDLSRANLVDVKKLFCIKDFVSTATGDVILKSGKYYKIRRSVRYGCLRILNPETSQYSWAYYAPHELEEYVKADIIKRRIKKDENKSEA
jgi:hypothetical protein